MDRSLLDSGASEIVVGEFYSFPPGKLYNKKGIYGYNDYKMYIQLNYTISIGILDGNLLITRYSQ